MALEALAFNATLKPSMASEALSTGRMLALIEDGVRVERVDFHDMAGAGGFGH